MPDDVQDPPPVMLDFQRPPPIVEQIAGPPMGTPRLPPRPPMATIVPPQTMASPQWQQQAEKQMIDIYRKAQSVKQAENDVNSARHFLGLLQVDREVRNGTPIDQALYRNMQYFVNPSDKNFASTMKALRPPAPPTMTNFPVQGGTVPAVIDPTGRPHFVPRTAMPTEPFKATVEEIAPGVRAAKLGPNHYQLLDRPNVKGTLSAVVKMQTQLWRDKIKALREQKKMTKDADMPALDQQIDALEQKAMDAAAEAEKPSRLKWNPEKGDFE